MGREPVQADGLIGSRQDAEERKDDSAVPGGPHWPGRLLATWQNVWPTTRGSQNAGKKGSLSRKLATISLVGWFPKVRVNILLRPRNSTHSVYNPSISPSTCLSLQHCRHSIGYLSAHMSTHLANRCPHRKNARSWKVQTPSSSFPLPACVRLHQALECVRRPGFRYPNTSLVGKILGKIGCGTSAFSVWVTGGVCKYNSMARYRRN